MPPPETAAETLERDLEAIVLASPLTAAVIAEWDAIGLPDAFLAAGAVAQTVWNRMFDLPPTHGIADIDIVYHDADDLSQASEARHAERIAALFGRLPVRVDVKNEARVHLWYEARFGYSIAPYRSTADAIATFPTTATAIGLRPNASGLRIEAPFGVADLMDGIVRANRRQITRAIYEEKARRWRGVWPRLAVLDWTAGRP